MRKRILGIARHEVEIRKSRFVAQAVPLPSVAEAPALIERLSTQGISHNCWAWRFGGQYRFSDDGEPGGTAGRPILAAIENRGFDQTLIVVSRWYGGIQLGTGGLARAYGGCANSCLLAAASEPLIEQAGLECLCPYPLLETFKNLLLGEQGSILGEDFRGDGVYLRMAVPVGREQALQEAMLNLSRGEVMLRESG